MKLGKKRVLSLAFALAMAVSVFGTLPGFAPTAQAATVVEQRLQEYISAHPAGGAAYNCMTFAKEVFQYVFGYNPGKIDYHGNARSDSAAEITYRVGSNTCGQISGETAGDVTVENLKALFSTVQPGDIIEGMTAGHGMHTMVVVNADDAGVTVYHGNWNGKIAYTNFTYEKFAEKWSHVVTVYHATNYDALVNPLNAKPVTADLTLEGEKVEPKVYSIDGTKYYSLRDIAYLMGETPYAFTTQMDENEQMIFTLGVKMATDGSEMTATDGNKKNADLINGKILVNGEVKDVDYYMIDGRSYFAIRDLADLVGFDVEWNADANVAEITFVDDLVDTMMSVDNDIVDLHMALEQDGISPTISDVAIPVM